MLQIYYRRLKKMARPSTKSHKCQNDIWCTEDAAKDKYGNYKRYCSDGCRDITTPLKITATYATKDIGAITKTREATVLKKHGVTNVSKTKAVKDQLRVTTKATAKARKITTVKNNLENYGVKSTNSLQSVKDTKKATFQRKYGVDHQLKIPSVAAAVSKKNTDNAEERLALAKITKDEIYGDENYNNRPKYIKTCIERFGVENPSQDAVIHNKKLNSQYRKKQFIFPSGRQANVMGYEPLALTELLKVYHENDIIVETTLIPKIKYAGIDGKNHYYFPDIYIPKENLLIEVKSEYTYSSRVAWLHTNLAKRQGSIDAGYNFKFMIMK
jgi:hypothetical protein